MDRIIIDVREPFEFEKDHVQGALNIPPSKLMSGAPELKDVPKDTELVLYCVSGSRSRMSTMILQQQGFTNVINGINKDHVISKYFN
jgi:rhodanese-related sulfurtransferase